MFPGSEFVQFFGVWTAVLFWYCYDPYYMKCITNIRDHYRACWAGSLKYKEHHLFASLVFLYGQLFHYDNTLRLLVYTLLTVSLFYFHDAKVKAINIPPTTIAVLAVVTYNLYYSPMIVFLLSIMATGSYMVSFHAKKVTEQYNKVVDMVMTPVETIFTAIPGSDYFNPASYMKSQLQF